MPKTISALTIAVASITAPALAQEVKAPVAPVATNLSSSGLAGAYIAGGVAIAGVVAISILAADGNDSSSVTSTPGS